MEIIVFYIMEIAKRITTDFPPKRIYTGGVGSPSIDA